MLSTYESMGDFAERFDSRSWNHPCLLRYSKEEFYLLNLTLYVALEKPTGKAECLFHHVSSDITLFDNRVFHSLPPLLAHAMIWPASALAFLFM